LRLFAASRAGISASGAQSSNKNNPARNARQFLSVASMRPLRGALGATQELAQTKFCHTAPGKYGMPESVHCDHCEEEFEPEELVILDPPTGHGELICVRCIEIKLRRAIAQLPRDDN
jgi:hypothetical protein